MRRHGSGRRTDLVRSGGEDVVQDELISRRELGDNLIANPGKGTLCRHRTDISGMRSTRDVLRSSGRDGGGVPDGDAHGLPGTFGPGPVVLVVGVRWQALVKRRGRGGAAVERSSKVKVVCVLVHDLGVSTRGGGRGRAGWGELDKGRVVN